MFSTQERERLIAKFGALHTIDDDTAFVLKNLELYNEDQRRRLTGNVVEIKHIPLRKTTTEMSTSSSDHNRTSQLNETNPNCDELFLDKDSKPMTPESQSLLDEMFSS